MKPTIVNPYGARLWVATTPKQWAIIRDTITLLPESPGGAMGSTTECIWSSEKAANEFHIVVWINRKKHKSDPDSLIVTIVHESVHVAQSITDWIGHKPTGTDEPTAYLVEWIFTNIINQVKT